MTPIEGTSADLRVAPPTDYISNSSSLPAAGRYDFVILDFAQATTRDGDLRNAVEIREAEIISDGPAHGKRVRNLTQWGATYLRDGVRVSGLGDMCAGIDAAEDWSADGMDGALRLYQLAKDRRLPIRARFQWEGFDKEGFDAAGGQALAPKSPEEKELRKRFTIKGMRKFKQLPNGSYYPEVEVSDEYGTRTVKARLVIDGVSKSSDWR